MMEGLLYYYYYTEHLPAGTGIPREELEEVAGEKEVWFDHVITKT